MLTFINTSYCMIAPLYETFPTFYNTVKFSSDHSGVNADQRLPMLMLRTANILFRPSPKKDELCKETIDAGLVMAKPRCMSVDQRP